MKKILVWLFVIISGGIVWIFANNHLYDSCLKGSNGACTAYVSIYPFAGNLAYVYYNRGMNYKKQGDTQSAIADFRKALANSSGDFAALARSQLTSLGAAP